MGGQIVLSTLFSDQVLSVELKNTQKSNALSLKMLNELLELLSDKKIAKKYKLLVLKGYKDGPFSAGADLAEIKKLKRNNNIELYHTKLNKLLKLLNKIDLIKISVLKSHCIGAGFILAINADIMIANSSCFFSIPASKLGIKLPSYQIQFLKSKFPNNTFLKEILLTGRKFSSQEAYNFNIVNLIFDDKNFYKNYLNYIEDLIKNGKKTLDYYYKRLV